MDNMPFKQVDDFQYTALTEFDQLVMPWVPGVQAPLYQLIREQTLRSFCARTGALIGQLPVFKVFDGQSSYSLEGVPDLMDILQIKQMRYAETGTQLNEAAYRMDVDTTTFELQSSWDGTLSEQTLIPVCTFTMARGAVLIETAFFERWADRIAAGIASQLMIMPKKAWSNPAAAVPLISDYENAVANAKIAVSRNFDKYAMRTVRPFI
jgi:hypothetical protein